MQTFVGLPEDDQVVCHYDDIKTNNLVDIQSNDIVNKGFIPDRYLDKIGVNNLKAFSDSSLNVYKIMDNSISAFMSAMPRMS